MSKKDFRSLILIATFVLIVFSNETICLGEPEGDEILKASDEKWIPRICSYTLTARTVDNDGIIKTETANGYKKNNDRNVLIVKEPKRMAGSVHLRKQSVIWSYFNTNQELIKVAYQSVFMGSLLNYGDVMAIELSYDYNVAAVDTNNNEYILTLQPKPGHEGYAKIILNVSRQTLLPVKRNYYALSGVLLKVNEFKDFKFTDGNLIHVVQEFYEPLKERKTSVIYDNIKSLPNVPEKYFNENYIKYLSGE